MRKPAVSGQFYEDNPEVLEQQIRNCFLSKFGPKELPAKKKNGVIKGIISAHAGYVFSGPAMACGYKALWESEFPDVFLMLGPSHSGHETCLSTEDWETPLGIVKVDLEFAEILAKNGIREGSEAHWDEHSIEVQLPFLQFISKENISRLRIVPIMIGEDNIKETAAEIKKSTGQYNKKVCIITSSDFTHFGHNYGYVPFSSDVKKNMYKLDSGAIEKIKKMDSEGFVRYCDKTGATICGRNPIAIMLTVLKESAKKAELLQYYTSGDIAGDYRNAVGYASIVIK